MVRGEPGGPRARQDALGKQAIYQTGNWRGMLGIEPLLVCAICSVFFQNSQEILLTSWAPGPQGPDCEKVGPFQAGPGSSSAMSPSLAHNLKDKRFGQKCFVLVYQAGWMVSILLAADSTSLNGLNCGESCFPQVAAMIEGLKRETFSLVYFSIVCFLKWIFPLCVF